MRDQWASERSNDHVGVLLPKTTSIAGSRRPSPDSDGTDDYDSIDGSHVKGHASALVNSDSASGQLTTVSHQSIGSDV